MTASTPSQLRAPFDRIFGDLDRAEQGRELIDFSLRRLGVDAPDHPLCAMSLRRRRLQLSFGNWWVLGIEGEAKPFSSLTVALFDDQTLFDSWLHRYEGFAKRDADERSVRLVRVASEDLVTAWTGRRVEFDAQNGAALDFIRERFTTWERSPYLKAHRAELVAASAEPLAWRELMVRGLGRGEDTGFWWVNQKTGSSVERSHNVLWTNQFDGAGHRLTHHDSVGRVAVRDVIFHHVADRIEAISVAVAPPEEAPRPGSADPQPGILVRTDRHDLAKPLSRNSLPPSVLTSASGAFTASGRVRPGYLWPLSDTAAAELLEAVRGELDDAGRSALEEVAPPPPGDHSQPRSSPRVWLFQANPHVWNLSEFLAHAGEGALLDFNVSRYGSEIQTGDTVLLWQSGAESGLRALATVLKEMYVAEFRGVAGPHVDLRIERVLSDPVPRGAFLADPVLAEMQIIRAPQGTNFRVTQEEWLALKALLSSAPVINPVVELSSVSDVTGIAKDELQRWCRAIERRGQAILYGPPGTGKTFVARLLADHLVGGGDGIVELVQFHPAYAYEDFIQGLRPTTDADGQLTYRMERGRFQRFLDRANAHVGISVLIIDEINRANLARVFGELMYLLEYRDETVALASGGALSIPHNVRIIATMNTADRSIALVDHALRRRFAFLPLRPQFDVLRRFHQEKSGADMVEVLIDVLHKLHQEIGDPNLHLGISYFLVDDLRADLEDVWRTEIEPYLEELFFDRPDPLGDFAWSNLAGRFQRLG